MNSVPQKTLHWLHNVLANEYRHAGRAYSDVAQALSYFPYLTLRTNVYTFENGRSALLLNVQGTVPVNFRDSTYAFPISIWIPQEYPELGPIGFVEPTKDMVVRPGQFVAGDGRIYHPYLAGWRNQTSNILDFFSVLRDIFSQEPPVVAMQEPLSNRGTPGQRNGPTPPVPPLPPKPRSDQATQQTYTSTDQTPPRLPPKEPGPPGNNLSSRYQQPLPPPTVQSASQHNSYPSEKRNSYPQQPGPNVQRPLPEDPSRPGDGLPSPSNNHQPNRVGNSNYYQHPANPLRSDHENGRQSFHPSQNQGPGSSLGCQRGPDPRPTYPASSAIPPNNHYNAAQQAALHGAYQGNPAQPNRQQVIHQQIPQTQKPKPAEDLLTSPFETALPAQPSGIAPPPIPPNPQKDALLSALSQTLTQQAQSTYNSNASALHSLRAQQDAIASTLNAINAEISQLNDLEALLSSNETILHKAMKDADKVLEDATRREVPNVDEVLVAPTVVAGQLYQLVAEENAIEESRGVLGKALDKGRIGSGIWAKQTRSLAREEFLKKALIKKISRGMGLVDGQDWG